MDAGEILITSIDRDGSMEVYDLELIRRVSAAVTIPVIAFGGAGNYELVGALLISPRAKPRLFRRCFKEKLIMF